MSSSSAGTRQSGSRPSDHKTGPPGEPMTPVPSASLVVLCPIRTSHNAAKVEYTTLMLQRSARIGSSFRSAVVFPGGQLDLADEAPFLSASSGTVTSERGQVMLAMDLRNEAYMSALRLCAVRETFEETGLLLLPSRRATSGKGMPLSRAVGYEEAGMAKEEWLAIRDQVHNDASHFVPFLRRIWSKLKAPQAATPTDDSCVPIAAMIHYSNWLTPRSVVRPAKRFDAHFFLTSLDAPNVLGGQTDIGLAVDGNEATSLCLGAPEELLQAAFEDRQVLYPPQAYSLADLAAHIRRYAGSKAHDEDGEEGGGLPAVAPLVFGTTPGAGAEEVTKVEEEARGLGGRNYTWERKDATSSSSSSKHHDRDGISPQAAAWVSTASPPFLRPNPPSPSSSSSSPTSSSNTSDSDGTKIQADLTLLRKGVTAIEPHPLVAHGMNLPASLPGPDNVVVGDADCDSDVFVFPLVLPGDWQASASQRRAAGEEVGPRSSSPPSTGSPRGRRAQVPAGQEDKTGRRRRASPGSGAATRRRPLNRLFVSPRSREDGGGLVVKGAKRRGVGALMDFEIGLTLDEHRDGRTENLSDRDEDSSDGKDAQGDASASRKTSL